MTTRRADERGTADYGWLLARYSFSFAGYHDPERMGFRSMRVLNEDRIAPNGSFPMHDHRDMEILTYVIEGAIEHQDSMGNSSTVNAGEFQIMSAGTGVTHSEANPSRAEELHLLQIWIHPSERGLTPRYAQASFDDRTNFLRRVVSNSGEEDSLRIHQDVEIYSAILEAGASVQHELKPERHLWIQVVRGSIQANGTDLAAGDSASISDEASVAIVGLAPSEFLLFELA